MVIKTQLLTEWEDSNNNGDGDYHIYAISHAEGYTTLFHGTYLCNLKVSSGVLPTSDFSHLENLKYSNNLNINFIDKVCPKCRLILDEQYPLNEDNKTLGKAKRN